MLLKIVSIILILNLNAWADNWSFNNKKNLPAQKDENRIIKWCDKETGKKTRYASANVELAGYKPCGAIKSIDVCDANGNKFLGDVPKKGIFTQCSSGEIVKDGETIIGNDTTIVFDNKGLSDKELEREIKKVAKAHNSDPDIQMQMLADNVIKGFFGKDNKDLMSLMDQKNRKELFKKFVPILENYIKILDQDTQKAIKPLIEHVKKNMDAK